MLWSVALGGMGESPLLGGHLEVELGVFLGL